MCNRYNTVRVSHMTFWIRAQSLKRKICWDCELREFCFQGKKLPPNSEDDYVTDEDEGAESDKKKNNKTKVTWSTKLSCTFDIYKQQSSYCKHI